VYVQPHFDYDPANDHLIPCREAGIGFKRGDLLQIVNREDPNWWQVMVVVLNNNNTYFFSTGLILVCNFYWFNIGLYLLLVLYWFVTSTGFYWFYIGL
jgi:hypothetical protein